MADLIDSVANLIDTRDKDHLENTLTAVLFELVDAVSLVLWRLVRERGVAKLVARARLPAPPRELLPGQEELASELSPDLISHFASDKYTRPAVADDGLFRHRFPISDGVAVVCLLEIANYAPLRDDQEQLVFGLLRVYRIHLGLLDYGDTDELTGLLNRRPFDEVFRRVASPAAVRALVPEEVAGHRRSPASDRPPLAHLAVVDIDFFKRVNDQFGHPYGDEVLVLLARAMHHSFRATDRLFRFGGEEFVLILVDANSDEARVALERFRAHIEAFAFPRVGRVTISIGFTRIEPFDTGADAFGRADKALYFAKKNGRNQVRHYEALIGDGALAPAAAVEGDIDVF